MEIRPGAQDLEGRGIKPVKAPQKVIAE